MTKSHIDIDSVGSDALIQRDKKKAPTWVAAVASSAINLLTMFINIFNHFNWSNVFVLHDIDGSGLYVAATQAIMDTIPKVIPHAQVTLQRVRSNIGIDYANMLQDFRSKSRGKLHKSKTLLCLSVVVIS